MNLPETNEQYGTKEYWNERYSKELNDKPFDWFKSYQDIAHIIKEFIPDQKASILMLGCGNSALSEEMYDDGYVNITNVDYSEIVINHMQSINTEKRPAMKWQVMDVRDLQFDDNSFDVAIDKGTMDAMMTTKGDVWDPPEQVLRDCNKEVDEVIRVLKKGGGIFLYITFGQPHFRRRYLTRPDTTLKTRQLGEMFHYFTYILKT